MLLQQVIFQLDAELDCLHAIRTIVVGLATVSSQPRTPRPQVAVAVKPEPENREAVAVPARRTRLRKVRAARTLKVSPPKPRETTALNGPVPSGPVVISVQALQREREIRAVDVRAEEPEQIEVAPQVALDALSRDITARWLMSSPGSAQ